MASSLHGYAQESGAAGASRRRIEMTRVALEGTKVTVELRDDVVFLRWAPCLTIEEQDAEAAITAVRSLPE